MVYTGLVLLVVLRLMDVAWSQGAQDDPINYLYVGTQRTPTMDQLIRTQLSKMGSLYRTNRLTTVH